MNTVQKVYPVVSWEDIVAIAQCIAFWKGRIRTKEVTTLDFVFRVLVDGNILTKERIERIRRNDGFFRLFAKHVLPEYSRMPVDKDSRTRYNTLFTTVISDREFTSGRWLGKSATFFRRQLRLTTHGAATEGTAELRVRHLIDFDAFLAIYNNISSGWSKTGAGRAATISRWREETEEILLIEREERG